MGRCGAVLGSAAGVLVAAGAVACGGQSYELPERTSSVVAEEARVAALLERTESQSFDERAGKCSVRILGMDGGSTYAWATCLFPASADETVPLSGVSTAYRIDGTSVRAPQDGAGYGDSIRSMFPERLARAVLEDGDRLRPKPPQPGDDHRPAVRGR